MISKDKNKFSISPIIPDVQFNFKQNYCETNLEVTTTKCRQIRFYLIPFIVTCVWKKIHLTGASIWYFYCCNTCLDIDTCLF